MHSSQQVTYPFLPSLVRFHGPSNVFTWDETDTEALVEGSDHDESSEVASDWESDSSDEEASDYESDSFDEEASDWESDMDMGDDSEDLDG